ncbi:MAG TPA: hypothetical protein VKE94_16645 [Gemmataceae bacterium]|nr:hypothetical protein [Gemmataceae bacterium]
MSTSVTNGGYYLKVKHVATVEAGQDVVIKAGAVRQINSGITDISALNVIRLECNGGGILIDQVGNVSTTMGLTGPTHALVAPFGPTRRQRFGFRFCARRLDRSQGRKSICSTCWSPPRQHFRRSPGARDSACCKAVKSVLRPVSKERGWQWPRQRGEASA